MLTSVNERIATLKRELVGVNTASKKIECEKDKLLKYKRTLEINF